MPDPAVDSSQSYLDALDDELLPTPDNDTSSHLMDRNIEHQRRKIKSAILEKLMARQLEQELSITVPEIDQHTMAVNTATQTSASKPEYKWNARLQDSMAAVSHLSQQTEVLSEFLELFDQEYGDMEAFCAKYQALESKHASLLEDYHEALSTISGQRDRIEFLEARLKNMLTVFQAAQEGLKFLENAVESRDKELARRKAALK